MKNKPIKVGFDFDGVVAYNPFRIVRPTVAFIKKQFFGVEKLSFWYPKHSWQQVFWKVVHESSIYPARGVEILKEFVDRGFVEAHLVTARYSFLDDHLNDWLNKYKLTKYFASINLNKNDLQPHIFKEEFMKKYKLDYFVEDNLDIVRYLDKRSKTKIFWIYNILDRNYPYSYKFPYLEKALKSIIDT